MKALKILKPYEVYEPGHVVDFDDKLADKLIADGIAKPLTGAQPHPVVVVTEVND